MNRYRTLLPVLAVAAPLALAAPAVATEYGSDLNPVYDPSSLACPSGTCTLVQTSFGSLPSDGVITRWRAKLNSGAQARLRLIQNNYGDSYWPVADGPAVTGNGGVSSVATRIPLNGGRYYAGIELGNGSIQTDHYSGAQTLGFSGSWPANAWRGNDLEAGDELLSQVTVEPDVDGDGYGDETQDSCVFCSTGGGGGTTTGGGGNSSSGGSGGGGSSTAPYGSDRPAVKLAIDKRAFFEFRDHKPRLTVYFDNQGNKDLTGTVALKWGRKTLKPATKASPFEIEWDTQGSSSNFVVPKSLVKRITRRGSASLTAVAKVAAKGGKSGTFTQKLKVRSGGLTNRYDGTYKGSNGITIVVSGGFLININQTLNTFCQGSNKFLLRTLYTLGGYPLMIGRDGSFKAKGNQSSDSIRYEGKLKPRGTFKGYSSIFHTQLRDNSEGRIAFEQCFAASNWTAKRVKK